MRPTVRRRAGGAYIGLLRGSAFRPRKVREIVRGPSRGGRQTPVGETSASNGRGEPLPLQTFELVLAIAKAFFGIRVAIV